MINFEVSNQTKAKIDLRLIKKIIADFSVKAKIKKPTYLSLAFVDKRTVKKWNSAYRGKDKPTDVLSFADRDAVSMPGEEKELGEIIICLPVAREQAKKYGWDLDYEISRLLIHGLAHLIGYEHEGVCKAEAERMSDFEKSVIMMSQ